MAPKELAAFRLPPHLLDALRVIKERDSISITDQVVRAIEAWVESRGLAAQARPAKGAPRRRRMK